MRQKLKQKTKNTPTNEDRKKCPKSAMILAPGQVLMTYHHHPLVFYFVEQFSKFFEGFS